MQFIDEGDCAAVMQPRAAADVLQKENQARLAAGGQVRDGLAHVARLGQPAAFGQPQKQAGQPVGKIAAEQEQVIVFELAEKFFRP